MPQNPKDSEAFLAALCQRIFALQAELGEASGAEYSQKYRELHRLKEQYKSITGIYPKLPPQSGIGEEQQ